MASIFTRIIAGDISARFIHTDDICVAFLDVRPLAHGHTLVVPRTETDHWTDLKLDTAAHLMMTAHAIGNAQRELLSPARIGLIIAGFEVPHVHIHVIPINSMADLNFANADPNPDPCDLDRLRISLSDQLSQGPSQVQ